MTNEEKSPWRKNFYGKSTRNSEDFRVRMILMNRLGHESKPS